jgi:hypothetical protein
MALAAPLVADEVDQRRGVVSGWPGQRACIGGARASGVHGGKAAEVVVLARQRAGRSDGARGPPALAGVGVAAGFGGGTRVGGPHR